MCLLPLPCDQLTDGGYQLSRDRDQGLVRRIVCSLVLGNGLHLRLRLVVRKDALHTLFVPAWRKAALLHVLRGFPARLAPVAFVFREGRGARPRVLDLGRDRDCSVTSERNSVSESREA